MIKPFSPILTGGDARRPYASGKHHYLIAKTFVIFYNHETQRTIGILVDMDANWMFELSEEQLDYFVRTGDRSHFPQPPDLDPPRRRQAWISTPSATGRRASDSGSSCGPAYSAAGAYVR